MKFKDSERSTKNLPVKLTFRVPDAKSMAVKVMKAGESAVKKSTVGNAGAKEGTVFVKDPER
jgi:hypothetical protein